MGSTFCLENIYNKLVRSDQENLSEAEKFSPVVKVTVISVGLLRTKFEVSQTHHSFGYLSIGLQYLTPKR